MRKWYRIFVIMENGSLKVIDSKSNYFDEEPTPDLLYDYSSYFEELSGREFVALPVWCNVGD